MIVALHLGAWLMPVVSLTPLAKEHAQIRQASDDVKPGWTHQRLEDRSDMKTDAMAVHVIPPAITPVPRSSLNVPNVVFTLLRGGDDTSVFIEQNKCIRRALATWESYDMIAFHEGNVPTEALARMQAAAPGLRLVDVHAAFSAVPGHVTLPEDPFYGVGYKHMCNFMANDWYRVLANYEYAMRVDEDVCVQHFPASNPFAAMRERGLVYAYGLLKEESHEETVATMQPWVDAYAAKMNISSAAVTVPKVDTIYFTNFFISKVGLLLTPYHTPSSAFPCLSAPSHVPSRMPSHTPSRAFLSPR